MKTICAYCPGFNRHDHANRHASHGMCDGCFKKLQRIIEIKEQAKTAAELQRLTEEGR